MRSNEDIAAEEAELKADIQSLKDRLALLRREKTQIKRAGNKSELLKALPLLSAALADAEWVESRGFMRSHWDPYTGTPSHQGLSFSKIFIPPQGGPYQFYAFLYECDEGKWSLDFSLGVYGTRRRKPVMLKGPRDEVRERAKKIMQERFLQVKRRLSKELE